ncbi:MAG: hypothetical protein ACLGIA_08795 [Actinomycetes bacterium]
MLRLVDADARADLRTFVTLARRADSDGDARLVGHGPALALAAYVSPVHGAGLPTVLGLRVFALAEPWTGDVLAPLAALTDRLARGAFEPVLPLPPFASAGAAWAGVSPPRSGWRHLGDTTARDVVRTAEAGIAEIAKGTPGGAGSAAVARLRGAVWSRPAEWSTDWPVAVPAGAAFAAHALGFVRGDGAASVPVYGHGRWVRLTTPAGHVLVRPRLPV